MNTSLQGRVLIVAGSDSGGGAGIQADIKATTAMGGFAMTAITAITVQNTLGVHGIHEVPVDFVRAQMKAVLEDIGADAVKTGMLHSAAMVEAVAAELGEHAEVPFLVVDPVMVAKGGASLLEGSAVAALKEVLIPLATLVTPNVPEAEVLTGRQIDDLDSQKAAADALLGLGCEAVLLKGGTLPAIRCLTFLRLRRRCRPSRRRVSTPDIRMAQAARWRPPLRLCWHRASSFPSPSRWPATMCMRRSAPRLVSARGMVRSTFWRPSVTNRYATSGLEIGPDASRSATIARPVASSSRVCGCPRASRT